MKKIKAVFSHLGVALSLSVLTITFLEARNPMMGFLTSSWSAVLIAALCSVCCFQSFTEGIALDRKKIIKKQKKTCNAGTSQEEEINTDR